MSELAADRSGDDGAGGGSGSVVHGSYDRKEPHPGWGAALRAVRARLLARGSAQGAAFLAPGGSWRGRTHGVVGQGCSAWWRGSAASDPGGWSREGGVGGRVASRAGDWNWKGEGEATAGVAAAGEEGAPGGCSCCRKKKKP